MSLAALVRRVAGRPPRAISHSSLVVGFSSSSSSSSAVSAASSDDAKLSPSSSLNEEDVDEVVEGDLGDEAADVGVLGGGVEDPELLDECDAVELKTASGVENESDDVEFDGGLTDSDQSSESVDDVKQLQGEIVGGVPELEGYGEFDVDDDDDVRSEGQEEGEERRSPGLSVYNSLMDVSQLLSSAVLTDDQRGLVHGVTREPLELPEMDPASFRSPEVAESYSSLDLPGKVVFHVWAAQGAKDNLTPLEKYKAIEFFDWVGPELYDEIWRLEARAAAAEGRSWPPEGADELLAATAAVQGKTVGWEQHALSEAMGFDEVDEIDANEDDNDDVAGSDGNEGFEPEVALGHDEVLDQFEEEIRLIRSTQAGFSHKARAMAGVDGQKYFLYECERYLKWRFFNRYPQDALESSPALAQRALRQARAYHRRLEEVMSAVPEEEEV